MTPTTLAAAILRDVIRWTIADNVKFLAEHEVLAALTAAMNPALSERAGEVISALRAMPTYNGGPKRSKWVPDVAADLITALFAQNAALRAERDEYADAFKADNAALGAALLRAEAAEAERDALRAERDEALEWLSASQGYIADAVFALDKQEKAEAKRDVMETIAAQWKARAEAAEAQIAALTARVERLAGALHNCVGMLDCLVAESGRSIEWGQEDPFRMGEWFEPDDLKQLAQARAALSATTEERK